MCDRPMPSPMMPQRSLFMPVCSDAQRTPHPDPLPQGERGGLRSLLRGFPLPSEGEDKGEGEVAIHCTTPARPKLCSFFLIGSMAGALGALSVADVTRRRAQRQALPITRMTFAS